MIVLTDNDIAILNTVKDKLTYIGIDLQWSGVTGYGLSVQAIARTIQELLEGVEE